MIIKKFILSSVCTAALMGSHALAEEPTILDEILVEGDDEVITEGKNTFKADKATVGGRQPQDIRDVPQTVNVLSNRIIEDAGVNSIEEASKLLPNLSEATGDGFIGSLYARGQEVFQYYVDGAPRPFLSIYGTAPDLHFFDRVEVLSGPSGVFQGSGEPVGTINFVRKRATQDPLLILSGATDTFGGYRGEFDVGGALNSEATIRARMAGYFEHEDSFVDVTEADVGGIYGTLEIDLTDSTTLSIGGIYENTETLRHSGLPTYTDGGLVNFRNNTFIGSTNNNADVPSWEAFAELEHEFDDGSVFKATARIYDKTADLRNLLASTPVDRNTGNFNAFWFARDYFETSYYVDANYTLPTMVWDRPVEVVVGADFRRTDSGFDQNFDFSPGAVNIATFNPSAFPLPNITFPGVGPGFRLNTRGETEEYGFYGQARIELTDAFKLNIGGRYSIYDSYSRDIGRGTSQSISETNFAPYIGATFDIHENVTLYGSYSTIFQPQSERLASGANLDPRQGSQIEFGVKTDLLDDRLSAQASYYIINDTNRAVADPANIGAFLASGEAETRGLEFTLSGEVFDNFHIFAGYSTVDTDLLNNPTPEESFSLYGKYAFDRGVLDGLEIGAGIRAYGDFDNFDSAAGVTIKAPGYHVVDLFASYKITENLKAQVNVNNVFDNSYIERVNTTTRGTYFGDPLNAEFKITLSY